MQFTTRVLIVLNFIDYSCDTLNIPNANKTTIEYFHFETSKSEWVVEITCFDEFFMVPSYDTATITYSCETGGVWNFEKIQCLRRKLIELIMCFRMIVLFIFFYLTVFFNI